MGAIIKMNMFILHSFWGMHVGFWVMQSLGPDHSNFGYPLGMTHGYGSIPIDTFLVG